MKTFLIDTNVFLHDPTCLKSFGNNEVVIPISVLDELDSAKNRVDECGRNARESIRILDDLRSKGSLSEGVNLDDSIIRVELNHQDNIPKSLSEKKVDNRLIGAAIGLSPNRDIIVITKDINLRVKCDALGIKAKDYDKNKVATEPSSIYNGYKTCHVPSGLIDDLYFKKELIIPDLKGHPNQFILLRASDSENHFGLAKYMNNGLIQVCRPPKEVWGINPRNLEQKMAMDLLLDPCIKLVTLVGRSGCGKTLLSAAAAMQQMINSSSYQCTLLSRPIQPMGRDIGYLPGAVEEKLDPWMQPLYDNLMLLLGNDRRMIDMYKEQGLIQIEPLTYIRGRSIPKSFFIIDEAQNLSITEIKTIITRAGQDTKIVVTGDIEQIDNPYVDFADNGLTHLVERFKDQPIAGHVTLRKGERSELSRIAAQIL